MTSLPLARSRCCSDQLGRCEGFPFWLQATILLAMTALRTKLDFPAAWHAFVDAYIRGIDLAPVGRRHLFIPRDMDALWADFMRTQLDFAEAEDKILADPDRYLRPPQASQRGAGADDVTR